MENGDMFHPEEEPTYAEAFPPLTSTASGDISIVQLPVPESSWPIKSIPISTVTQVFHVPLEERRYTSEPALFGTESQQASIVREIMEKTGCAIEMSQAKDQSLTIMVTGRPSHVNDAKRLINMRLHTQCTYDVHVPKEHHKSVLGRQGARLKKIEVLTNTKINVPRPDDPSEFIRVTGSKEGADKARHEIQSIADEMAKLAFERVNVEFIYQPFINGPNGTTLNEIQELTKTRINIPPYTMQKDEITIAGEKEGVAMAKAQVLKMLNELRKVCSTVSVEVRKSQHKYIVRPKGQGIQDILQSTGVFVEVPSLSSEDNTITLRGPQEKLGVALTQVYEKANSVVTEEVKAPAWLHRFIIGRGGLNVKKITQNLPHINVTFVRDDEKIVIEGTPEEVLMAKESFEAFTEDLMATMVFAEVHVKQKYHPHIIGKKGTNVNQIKKETCTSIIIPSDELKSDCIRIEGDPKGVAAAKKMIIEMTAKLENECIETVKIAQKWHGLIIGPNGEHMKDIRDRFSSVHVAFPEKGERCDSVTLRGPKEEVRQCAAHLKKQAADIVATNYRQEVHVFKKFHGSIIGRGGATLRKIREETNTKIEMPKEAAHSDTIIITGVKENVEKARSRILEIQNQMATVTEVTIQIPHHMHIAIIGTKGKLIRSVMEECGGVRIHFPQQGNLSDDVHIQGPKDDVEKAKARLLELADKHVMTKYTTELRCKPEYHRFLIGRGGANIRQVRDQFDARVIFPQKGSDDEAEVITIIGRKENAEAARAHLQKLIEDLDKVVENEIFVERKYHRHFIQRRGQLIHEVSEENGGVIISFPMSSSTSEKVLLKGAPQCVEGAKAAIKEIIEDLEAQVSIECIIPRKHHRDVMGPKGSNVQGVSQEHNVTIKFPEREKEKEVATKSPSVAAKEEENTIEDGPNDDDSGKTEAAAAPPPTDPRDIIMITGHIENCEAAKEALLELVPVTVMVDVPYEFHGSIIGQRGREVRSLADEYRVNIDVPRAELKQSVITVYGPPKCCENTRQALLRKVQQFEAEKEERELRSFTEVLRVDSKYHPNIIGRKGATINKIRDDYDVRIQLPDKGGTNLKEITIIGYQHQVQAAIEEILRIVQELEDQVTEEVEIDHRVHSRLIGARGKSIGKVMDKFHVVVRFPKDKTDSAVTITGTEENVEDAKEHLLMLAEDYMQDVIQQQEEQEIRSQYTRPTGYKQQNLKPQEGKGFVVKGAPWSSSTEDFPAIGNSSPLPADVPSTKKPSWGPSALGPKLPKKAV